MRIVRSAALVLALAACSSPDPSPPDAPTVSRPASPTATPAPTTFPAAGCPIDDGDACDVIAAAATALVDGDAAALHDLSRAEPYDCAELPVELFPGCEDGGVLRGHAMSSSQPFFKVLPPPRYRVQLEAILGNVDPSFSDDHGSGSIEVLGVGTCGPEEIDRRSYHLGVTAAVSERSAPPERLLGSFEFVHRDGRWWIGVWYLDTLAAWEETSLDPFTSIACGNMQPWGAA